MKNFYKVSNTIENGPRMDRVKSRIGAMSHQLWTVIAPMLFVAFGLFGVNESAWAYWTTDRNGNAQADNASIKGYVQEDGGTYYVLYALDEESISLSTSGKHVEKNYNINGPANILTFEAKKNRSTALGNLRVAQRVIGVGWNDKYNNNPGTSYEGSGNIALDEKAVELSFYNEWGGGSRSFRYVKVTMASYFDLMTDSIAFGNNYFGTSEDKDLKIYWSNTGNKAISKSGDTDRFTLSTETIPSQAGYYGNTVVTITYKRDVAGSHLMTLTINGKQVTVTGSTEKLDNSITWDPVDTSTKKSWGEKLTGTATATNNESGCPGITYSSSNDSYAAVEGNVITFLAGGAGQKVTITAHQDANYKYKEASKSKEFTIKAGQTIVWDPDKVDTNIRINTSRDITDYAYASNPSNAGTSRTISYSSATPDVLNVSIVDGKPVMSAGSTTGDVVITATLSGDADYNTVTSDKTFTVKDKETVEYYLGGNMIAENAVLNFYVGDSSALITSKNTSKTIEYNSTTPAVAIFDATKRKIYALSAGSTTITLSQKATEDYQAGARNVVVNVTRYVTNISVNTNAKTMLVGEEYDPELSTNNDETMTISSTNSDVVVYEDGVLKAKGEGTATITFSQAQSNKWTSDTETITVTVKKRNPNLTVTGYNATAWNETIEPTITSSNNDPNCAITLTKISGSDAAARVEGNQIVIYDKNNETVTFCVSQAGNNTYKDTTVDFSITVQKANNHVTYVKGDVTLSKNESQVIGFTGVPKKVRFLPSTEATADRTYNLYWSATGNSEDYTSLKTYDYSYWNPEGSETLEMDIDPSAKFLKVEFTGAWNLGKSGTFKGLTITERKEIVVNDLTGGYYNFGEWEVGNQATDRAIGIEWYSVPTTTVTSSNPGVFDVLTETIDSEIDDFDNSTSIIIRYHHKRVTPGTQDEATITLTSENGYTTSFKVKGKTVKKNQTLIWQDELSPLEVGTKVPNPAIAPLALNYTITATSADGVVDMDGTVLKAEKVGTVTIHVENDGDAMWNPVSGDFDIKVTALKVQHIRWDKTFTRLTTSDEDETLDATAYEYVDGKEVAITARSISYTSSNTDVVSIVDGKLHVVGVGTATLTASIPGESGVYEPASVTRDVKVRVKSTGCTPYVLTNAGYSLNTIETKQLSLSGEPAQITFKAKGEKYWGFIPHSGPMKFAEYYGGAWHERWSSDLSETSTGYGPIDLDRSTTKVKFYTELGATCYHTFEEAYVTKAKYLELDDTKEKTTTDVTFDDANLGQTYIKSVVVNYSNIHDMLYVDHTNPNFRITPTEIGEGCGENSRATITIIYYAKDVIDETDVITITDGNDLTATINVSASVSKSDQTIEWTPNTNLVTTDEVTFDAAASSGEDVSYALAAEDADIAEVTENGVLTIKTAGDIHVTASQGGSGLYNPVALEPITFHISKVTPIVSVSPSVAPVTLPKTLSELTLDISEALMVDDKGAEVVGEYAWVDETTVLTSGAHDYPVRFTPTKGAWYNEKVFNVSISAAKRNQTINWDFDDEQTLPCSAIVPLNATIKDAFTDEPMDVELTYSSDNTSCASIGNGQLVVNAPGTVIITVSRDGNETYNEASITRTITFEKATPVITTLPTANSIYEGQWLRESAINNGVVKSGNTVVDGSFEWVTEDFQAVTIGTQNYNIQFIPSNEACYNRVNAVIPMTILQIARVFNNATGDGNWNNAANWSNGFVPSLNTSVDVTVAEDVTVIGDANVGNMTINNDVTITVKGHLTITGTTQTTNNKYANVVVKDGGSLTTSNTIKVNNFSIEASQGTSGQIMNPEHLDIQGEAYIDITISTNPTLDEDQWYGFTVPFPVSATSGVERILPNGTVESGIIWNNNYAIASYDSQRRASGQKGWRAFSGVMTPGVFYLLGIDNQARIYRFHKTSTGNMVAGTEMALQSYPATGNGDSGDANWNAVGNPALRYSHASCPVDFVQIYDNNSGAYEPAYTALSTFVVGRPFFIQTGGGTLSISAADGSHNAYYAPRRTQERVVRPIGVLLEADGEICDKVFVRASEDATGEYVIGRDLQKLGTTTKKAQMWINALGKQLCVREETLNGGEANYELSLYAPAEGSYVLSVDETLAPEDANLYLTYNGNIIWDLTTSPCVVDLTRGTTTGYGLRIGASNAPQITTDIENGGSLNGENGVRKVIIDNKMYIITPEGKMYDIIGKSVKY